MGAFQHLDFVGCGNHINLATFSPFNLATFNYFTLFDLLNLFNLLGFSLSTAIIQAKINLSGSLRLRHGDQRL